MFYLNCETQEEPRHQKLLPTPYKCSNTGCTGDNGHFKSAIAPLRLIAAPLSEEATRLRRQNLEYFCDYFAHIGITAHPRKPTRPTVNRREKRKLPTHV